MRYSILVIVLFFYLLGADIYLFENILYIHEQKIKKNIRFIRCSAINVSLRPWSASTLKNPLIKMN